MTDVSILTVLLLVQLGRLGVSRLQLGRVRDVKVVGAPRRHVRTEQLPEGLGVMVAHSQVRVPDQGDVGGGHQGHPWVVRVELQEADVPAGARGGGGGGHMVVLARLGMVAGINIFVRMTACL